LVRQNVAFTPAVEAPRSEWFVRGTETASVELLAPSQRQPKIVYPADSSLIALDPDIPERLQRVRFQAQGERGLGWVLDGEKLGQDAVDAGWAPAPGKHELKLVGQDGRTVASARFEVRGGAQLVSTFSTSSGGSSARSMPASGENSGESER
jgi:penicillin-binding protein 1C